MGNLGIEIFKLETPTWELEMERGMWHFEVDIWNLKFGNSKLEFGI